MAAAFLLWSSGVSSSSPERRDDRGSPHNQLTLIDPAEPKDATAARPPRARRGGKAAGVKKPPQRGLGVAQLERLRIQERWKITERDQSREIIQPLPMLIPPIYDSSHSPLARYGSDSAGLWGEPTAFCYLPRCRLAAAPVGQAGYGPGPNFRSLVHEQYTMDRYRIAAGEGRLQTGSLLPELPSNQMMPCVSDHCEFCTRKKLHYDENSGLNGSNAVDYQAMDLGSAMAVDQETKIVGYLDQRSGGSARKMEVKEYDFFPHNRRAEDGDSEFGDRTVGDASSSSPAASPNFIDLSLRLSGWN